MTDKIREAAQALVDRWDSPAWGGSAGNLRHTGEYIAALRAALDQPALAQQPTCKRDLQVHQALTDPENQPNQFGVEFGMTGTNMHFKIGNQLFKLDYEPDEQEEFEFMKRMLIHAFSTFTPDVKTVVQQPAVPPHAEIYMGDGFYALCDWADFDAVKGFNWNLTTRNKSGCIYAQAWDSKDISTRKQIRMHWLVLPASDGFVVDHINGNGLDNRRSNLRLVTPQQNAFNQKSHGGSSQYKGVSFDKESGLWRSYIRHSGRRIYLGRHALEIEAAKAYDMAAKEYFGEHAKLNLA